MSTNNNNNAILQMQRLGAGPMPTQDPFLFCVYHKDQYPPGNDDMEAPWPGNGHDFNPEAPYRMYHGSQVPGFPQHPHRGFETITATMEGMIDHADSLGNAGRYGHGDVQWMTAGKGCVHSEMFPLLHQQDENPTRFFQIWINLPQARKMVDPGFAMFWAEQVPKWKSDNGLVSVTTFYAGHDYVPQQQSTTKKEKPLPPAASWAYDPDHDVAVLHITIQPGGSWTLPPAKQGPSVHRSLFYIEGDAQAIMSINGQALPNRVVVDVAADQALKLEYSSGGSTSTTTTAGEFLLLQGIPMDEPVAQHGPFVMNSRDEIQQAFMDYSRTKFGGWPWPRDDMVFPRDKGRFALMNGTESTPNDDAAENGEEEKAETQQEL